MSKRRPMYKKTRSSSTVRSRRFNRIVILATCIILVCGMGFLIYKLVINKNNTDNKDISRAIGVAYNNTPSNQPGNIVFPGYTDIAFTANSLRQSVDIYNPIENNCYMNITLVADNETIWECDRLMPGYGFNEITLVDTLPSGDYSAELRIRCFLIDSDAEVNGGVFKININSK